MALSEMKHHTSRGQRKDRAGGEARVALHGHVPEAPLPQGWILRHVVGHLPAPSLDVPVPQMVDQLPDIEHFFAALSPDPEQVIEVPKILPLDVPVRAALRVTQLVEQLVEVPTTVSFSSLQRTVEQHVDIPVPGGGGPSSGLQGFLPRQRSTASPSRKRISERIVEQIVDPVSRGSLPGSLPGQSSSSSHSPAGVEERADEPGEGVFRTFPKNRKSAKVAPHSGSELPPHPSSRRRFTGRIWHMPAAGLYGYIESDSAKAAYAFEGDVPFLLAGSCRLGDHVTFAVGRGADGLEAYDLKVVGKVVRGLASPHLILGALSASLSTTVAVHGWFYW